MTRIDQQKAPDVEAQLDENAEDPRLRLLRHLVTLLLMVFILSALIITTALVYKLTRPDVKGTVIEGSAPRIIIPEGDQIREAHFAEGQLVLVVEDARGRSRVIRYDTTGVKPDP